MSSKILVIDDEKLLRENVCEILENEGYEVHSACDGREGINKAHNIEPDLILCDIMMPNLDGYQVIEELKAGSLQDIPIIIFTAKSDRVDERLLMSKGVDDYLTKPFSTLELIDSIKARLSKKLRQENKISAISLENRLGFLCTIHDLHSPADLLRGMNYLLTSWFHQMETVEPDETKNYIFQYGWNITRHIKNAYIYELLKQPDSGEWELKGEPVETVSMIRSVCSQIGAQYNRSSDIQLSLDESKTTMKPEFFKYVIDELLYNAFKFSAPGSKIKVTSSPAPGGVALAVSNQGDQAMSGDGLYEISSYKRNTQDLSVPGVGIGLYNIQSIIKNFKGNMQVSCENSVHNVAINYIN